MKPIKLYVDIDGVLLTVKNTAPAKGLNDFVIFIATNFDCHWLTTHCKGASETAVKYLSQYVESETLERLKSFKPTNWVTLKTEALEISSDFLWLEDFPFQAEKDLLKMLNMEDRLILVDLNKTDELSHIMQLLKQRIN